MFTCVTDDEGGAPVASCLCCQPALRFAERRITSELSRRGVLAGASSVVAALGFAPMAKAEATRSSPPIVFTNFQLFDGKSAGLRGGQSLLVEEGRIKQVAGGGQGAPEGARLIDCGGRVLLPGLIDAHWHTMFASLSPPALMTADIGFIYLSASAQAERTLMRGFTTVRDLGGPSFPLKQAIDSGLAVGPRIYPCGSVITTTGGHGDMRLNADVPRSPGGPPSQIEQMGAAAIADNADEVRLRVREQLFLGASQIKMVGGGGVASPRTTLDMMTFTVPELHAGVEAAADRNTYVAVHAYPPAAIRRAIDAGVQCIEHGHLMDEATAKLMADKGVWLSTQPFIDETDNAPMTGQSRINLLQVLAGTPNMYGYAKKYGIKTAWGSDLLFSTEVVERQGVLLNHMSRWYSNAEALKMATSGNAELLALSGPRNPYPGKLGVIEDGAYADLLVVAGDPLQDLSLLAQPDKNLVVIMKDGKIHKDARAGAAPVMGSVVE
ncbi:MAG TPA: amidohydrolase family protein [Caulobacteraceae bacterium]|nr:amidohydrolase family protein [Caulobacteraceae bacterium]